MNALQLRVTQSCKALFLGALGQEVYRDLKAEFSDRTSVDTMPVDPLRVAYMEGQRSVILTIEYRMQYIEEGA